MPTRLTNLRLDEVSLVDRGANQHAKIMLVKRDNDDIDLVEYARKHLADGSAFPEGITKNHFADEIAKRSAEIRKAGETREQASARFMTETEEGKILFAAHKAAEAAPRAIVEKRVARTIGYTCLKEKADELRRSNPKFTAAQAMARAYADPANRNLVDQHRAEQRRMAGR